MTPFAELRAIILNDPALMEQFTAAPNEADLFAQVISLGRQRGLHVTISELEGAIRANRRSWLERWTFQ